MVPLRQRWRTILLLAVAAPICGEYLQAYLPSTGDLPVMVGSLVILAPLYGGAALLIREVAVRRGLGWTGVLLLAGGFGLLMPGVVDLALFGEHRDELEYWDAMREGTLIAPLGISAYTALTWSVSHVVMSIGAPLAVLSALAPRHRGRPLLGRRGIAVTAAAWLLAATFIRADGARIYGAVPTATQTIAVLAVVAAIVALALSPVGRPVVARGERRSRPVLLVLAGLGGAFVLDGVPWTWPGVAVLATVLVAGSVLARRRAIGRSWVARETGALASGALIGRSLVGFLAPATEGGTLGSKLAQNSLLLAGTLAVAWLVVRSAPAAGADRTPRTGAERTPGTGAGRTPGAEAGRTPDAPRPRSGARLAPGTADR